MRPFFENVVETLRLSAAARGNAVRQVRSDTREALIRHRLVRRSVAGSLRRTRQQHRAAVIERLTSALAPIKPARPARTGVAEPAPIARRPLVDRAGVWEFWADTIEDPVRDASSPVLQREILRVIQAHGDGVGAREIGNELGIDWRRVVGVTTELAGAGLIEQVDQAFYPADATGRPW
jgi:hypothetical protein